MRWERTEFILKGIYLGLLLLIALQGPTWEEVGVIGAVAGGTLAVCLIFAAITKLREGYRPRGRLGMFLVFIVLENPGIVYAGVILGLTLGTYYEFKDNIDSEWTNAVQAAPVVIGAVLGLAFLVLRSLPQRKLRIWFGLGLAVVLVGGAIAYLHFKPGYFPVEQNRNWDMAAYLLLLGLPGFYLLTFSSVLEESEIEFGAICAALGIGLWILGPKISPNFNTISLIVPVMLYFFYTRRIMPGLRVGKHVLRGVSYARVGRYRWALIELTRAVKLDPTNELAREKLWSIHREMDFNQLVNDPETLAVVNFELCLERVASLLLQDRPTPKQIKEAHDLLDLVVSQRPATLPRCNYWRAVALTHQREHEKAAETLRSVLAAPEQDSAQRRSILPTAWNLALFLHPELKKRVGLPLLQQPDRRLEAIAAAERQLAVNPNDDAARNLQRLLYNDLSERDYVAATTAAGGHAVAAPDFNYAYVQQLGLALLEDKERWERGCEYLRIAAHGLPIEGAKIFLQIAKMHQAAGDPEGVWRNYERAKQTARHAGVANLKDDDRHAVFTAVKALGEHEVSSGKVDAALDSFKFYSQYERAGLETYRTLADLFEKKGDLWMALHCTEHGLTYDPKDKDFLERRDRYYYSVTPEDLKTRRESVAKWFDVSYCKEKIRFILEKHSNDLDMIDWAAHLAELVYVMEPQTIAARLLRARVKRVKGELEEALKIFEDIRGNKPEKFGSGEEEEAWYLTHRILGELYIDEKPDQAVLCLQEYRNSPRSGANTLYNMGRAYENLGDYTRAARSYEQVTAFEGNPLVYEAQDALRRVKSLAAGS